MDRLGTLARSGIEEAEDLEELGQEARAFLQRQPWCNQVLEGFFDRGFSKVAVFYFTLVPRPGSGADEAVWVVTGDLSPGYLDTGNCTNGAQALDAYVANMEAWVDATLSGRPVDDIMPVLVRDSLEPVTPTPELVRAVESRMKFIRRELLSDWQDELKQ